MANTLTGRLYSGTAIQQRTEKFKVRTFILEITQEHAGNTYTNYAEFQLVNNNCALLDNFQKGQMVTVTFDVRGNMWDSPSGEQKCITNLNAWRIDAYQPPVQHQPAPQNQGQWGAQTHQPAPQNQGQWGAQTHQPAPQNQGQQGQMWDAQGQAPKTNPFEPQKGDLPF